MSEELEATPTGIDRRTFIKSSAVVGGLVWAAPAMSSFGARAFAGSPEQRDLCPTSDQPSGLRFEYTGLGCAGTDSPQFDDPNIDSNIVFCRDYHDYPSTPSNGSLTLEITGGPDGGTYTKVLEDLAPGNTFYSPPNEGKAGANTVFKVFDDRGTLVHEVGFHTSCSEPLRVGDNFGSFLLIDGVAAS